MFGKRAESSGAVLKAPPTEEKVVEKKIEPTAAPPASGGSSRTEPSEEYYETKATIFNALFETIDVSALAGMQPDKAREEIRTIVDEIIAIRNVRLSVAEQNQLITEICDDILGYGPLSLSSPVTISQILWSMARRMSLSRLAGRCRERIFGSAIILS